MGARKGAARVGACLVHLENNLFVGPFSPSCGKEETFSYYFSHYVQNFFGANALVARVIANMLL